MADDEDAGQETMGTGDVGGQKHLERGLEASLRRRKEHFSKVIGGEPILRKEARLSRLYGVNPACPLVQHRAKIEVEPVSRAIDLPPSPPPASPTKPPEHSLTNPPWRPTGPAVKLLLKPSLTPEDRPHDPYIEPWFGSPLMWDKETEFVSGSTAKRGIVEPFRPSHHGLSAFEKLHKDDAKRKFQRGMQALKALVRLQGFTKTWKPHGKPRTQQEKKDDVDAMKALLARKGFANDGSRLSPPVTTPTPASPVPGSDPTKLLSKALSMFGGKSTLAAAARSVVSSPSPLPRPTTSEDLLAASPSSKGIGSPVNSGSSKKLYSYQPSLSLLQSIRSTKMSTIMRETSLTTLGSSNSLLSAGSSASPTMKRVQTPDMNARPGQPLYKCHELSGASAHPLTVDVAHRGDIAVRNPMRMPKKERGNHTKAVSVMVVESTSPQGAQTAEQRKRLREQLKWKELRALTGWMATGPDHMPNMLDLELLEGELRAASGDSGTPYAVTRDQFWSIVSLRGFPYPSANRLYSCFDADHTGVMDYRFLMASLRALRRPHEDTIAKMTAMFRYFLPDDDASAAVPRSDVIACLQLACSTDEDRKVLQQLIVEALQSRLGLKSLWARDVTRSAFHNVLSFTPVLVDCFATHLQASLKL